MNTVIDKSVESIVKDEVKMIQEQEILSQKPENILRIVDVSMQSIMELYILNLDQVFIN